MAPRRKRRPEVPFANHRQLPQQCFCGLCGRLALELPAADLTLAPFRLSTAGAVRHPVRFPSLDGAILLDLAFPFFFRFVANTRGSLEFKPE